MENFILELPVGQAKVRLGGFAITQNDRGRKNEHDVGSVWNPRDQEPDETVATMNQVEIEGYPGPGISIEVRDFSIQDNKIYGRLKPTFVGISSKTGKKIRIWKSDGTIAVNIKGEKASENWVVSHLTVFSGRTIFDLAKDKIILWPEDFSQPLDLSKIAKPTDDGDNHKPSEELDEETKQAIAGEQLDHGLGKNSLPS